MGIRIHNEDFIHFITNRCEHEMMLLLPTTEINQIITFWLTKAKEKHGQNIKLFAFIFLSNHYHMLCQDPEGELPAFIGYFQANVAKAINKHINRHGKFWSREYDDVIVDGEEEFWNRFAYTTLNAVKSGLVESASHWKGVHSLDYILENIEVIGTGINASNFYNANRFKNNANRANFKETFKFHLSPPPMHKNWSINERKVFIEELLEAGTYKYLKAREFKKALGMAAVLKQRPLDRPKDISKKPRFKFMSFSKERQKELQQLYRTFVGQYKESMDILFKRNSSKTSSHPKTISKIYWPKGCYPPTCHCPALG